MTIEEGIDVIDRILQLRRELTAVAHHIQLEGATFIPEWRYALPALAERLELVAALEHQLEPVLAAPPGGERFTLQQLRAWLMQGAHPDEDGHPALPATRAIGTQRPYLH